MLARAAAWGAGRALQLRLPAIAQHELQRQRAMASSASKQIEPIELRISEELLARVQDKELLHTCGFIGGKWLQASDRSTYQVRRAAGRATPSEHWAASLASRHPAIAGN